MDGWSKLNSLINWNVEDFKSPDFAFSRGRDLRKILAVFHPKKITRNFETSTRHSQLRHDNSNKGIKNKENQNNFN